MDLLSLHSWTLHPRPGLGAGPISCPSLASCREAARRETEKSDHEPLPKKQKLKCWSRTGHVTISALEKNAAVIPQQRKKNL